MIDTVEPFALCIESAAACRPDNRSNLRHSLSTEGNWPFRPRMAGPGRPVDRKCHPQPDRNRLVAGRPEELLDRSRCRQTWPTKYFTQETVKINLHWK